MIDVFVVIYDGLIVDGDMILLIDIIGYYVLFGIIDMYGDVFEWYFVLCFLVLFFYLIGLIGMECDCVVNGVIIVWFV